MKYFFPITYILAIILANFNANNIQQLPILGSYAVGTLFFGAVFTLRDYNHQYFGKNKTYIIIILAVIINGLLALLGHVPTRIIFASVTAMFISEAMDTEVYHRLMRQSWAARALKSNVISIPVDTVLFTLLAFYGIWAQDLMINVIISDCIIKFVIAGLLILGKRGT